MSDPKKLLQNILKTHEGIALGEDHQSQEIFSFVRENIGNLKESGVKTLYIEAILSNDNASVKQMLKDGDDKGLYEYLKTRTWTDGLADQYFSVIKDYHQQGLEIVGIDIKTEDRFRTGNKNWESVIQDHQKNAEGKYIILGGASHFGNTFGPGVNITFGIPSINFAISDDSKTPPSVKPSEKKFEGRSVADYEITLPKKADDTAPSKVDDIAPSKALVKKIEGLKIEGLTSEDLDFLRQASEASLPSAPPQGLPIAPSVRTR